MISANQEARWFFVNGLDAGSGSRFTDYAVEDIADFINAERGAIVKFSRRDGIYALGNSTVFSPLDFVLDCLAQYCGDSTPRTIKMNLLGYHAPLSLSAKIEAFGVDGKFIAGVIVAGDPSRPYIPCEQRSVIQFSKR